MEYQRAVAKNFVVYLSNDEGASQIAREMAEEYGVQIQVYDQVETPTGVELLLMANSAIEQAAKHLDRPVPEHIYIQTLLQRNFRIIDKAKTIFAVGYLENLKTCRGGTGWSIQMALDLEKDVYVYDLKTSEWFHAEREYDVDRVSHLLKMQTKFNICLTQPRLKQSSPVVGAKRLGPISKNAIKNLFHQTFCTPENSESMRKALKEFDL